MRRISTLIFGAFCLCVVVTMPAVAADAAAIVTPPGQPASGPGGSDYAFNAARATVYGEGAGAYTIIEPRGQVDKSLPAILFVHGMGLTNHTAYRAWITHLARKGNVVIYPTYHIGGIVDPKTFTDTSAKAAREALAKCDGKQHAAIDTKNLTMIGHSLGGTIIANLAARPEHYKLPAPKALMLLQPGDTKSDKGFGALFPSVTEDHTTIPQGTLVLIVDVERDYFVSPKAGQRIYDNTTSIDVKDKRRLLLRTDDYAEPAIIADHMLPMAWTNDQRSQGRVNTYDYAAWRWFDALQSTALGDVQQREHVFGEAALDLGKWSDGTEIAPPIDQNAE